jgi:hypothetical protein
VMDYPTEELALYLGQSFKRLKAEQGRLLGATGTHRQRLRGRKGTELLALV